MSWLVVRGGEARDNLRGPRCSSRKSQPSVGPPTDWAFAQKQPLDQHLHHSRHEIREKIVGFPMTPSYGMLL